MASTITALSGDDVRETLAATEFLDVEPLSNIPIDFLEAEAEALRRAMEDLKQCANDPDVYKYKLLVARVLLHLRRIQATANDILPSREDH